MKKSLFALLFILFLSNQSYCQIFSKKIDRETKSFLSFIRQDLFKNSDTLRILNYSQNVNLFKHVLLLNCCDLSEGEILNIMTSMKKDTYRYFGSKEIISLNPVKLFGKQNNEIDIFQLSNPIFFRNYNMCIFSYESSYHETQYTYLFKKVSKKWQRVKQIGEVNNY